MRLTPRPPHRLNILNANPRYETNNIFSEIEPAVRANLGDISGDIEQLRTLYVYSRFSPRAVPTGTLNAEHPEQYTNNLVARWNSETDCWQPVRALTEAGKALRERVADSAELRLLDHLARISRAAKSALARDGRSYHAAASPEKRVLFVQAGVGTGKTTMLNHLVRVTIPDVARESSLPIGLVPVLLDFKGYTEAENLRTVWASLLTKARTRVEDEMSRRGVSRLWEKIAEPFMVLPNGDQIPEIAEAANPVAARSRFIERARVGQVFLERVGLYLAEDKRFPSFVVLILDNLEKLEVSTARQLAIINNLLALLERARGILAVVSVRESTLGNLSHLASFASQHHIERQHLTTPLISEVLQKRIDSSLERLASGGNIERQVALSTGITVTVADVVGMLRTVDSAFSEEVHSLGIARDGGERAAAKELVVSKLMHVCTNRNVRAALDMALTAIESWAIRLEEVLPFYYNMRTKHGRGTLPPFTFDEFLRLSMIGAHLFYSSDDGKNYPNAFGWGNMKPDYGAGRFPTLVKHRLMQFLDNAGRAVAVTDIRKALRQCTGYDDDDILMLLKNFLDDGLIESEEGNRIERIRLVYVTPKLVYILHWLCKTLVYLEHVRNDSVIEFMSTPHYPRSSFADDVENLLEFVWYIFDQERREYGYVKQRSTENPSTMNWYSKMATDQPICFKLFHGITKRINALTSQHIERFEGTAEQRIRSKHQSLNDSIFAACRRGQLYPVIRQELRVACILR